MKTETDGPDLAERIVNQIDAFIRDGDWEAAESDIRDITAPIEAELAELRAFAERFPKTADGVRIWPGMKVWANDFDLLTAKNKVESLGENYVVVITNRGDDVWLRRSDCYSTKAAMLAAKEGK